MENSRTRFYLDKQNAKYKGVLAGIADYTGIDVLWVRIAFLVLALPTHLFLVAAYYILAWAAPAKPVGLYPTADDAKFWQGARANPRRSADEVRASFRDLDRRLADIETLYTSRNSQLASEIDRLR